MKAIEFPEVNVRIAEKQEEYETLPVHVDMSDNRTKTTMCFELNEEEFKQVAETGRIWVQMLTFGYSFHPISMSFLKPEGFTEPQKPSTHIDDLDISTRRYTWLFKCTDCGKTLPMSKYSKLFDCGICVDCEPF